MMRMMQEGYWCFVMSDPTVPDRDPLDIPEFLVRKGKPPAPRPTTVALPVGEIIARERQGDRPTWQERELAVSADRKATKLKRLQRLKDRHPGMRWNPKKKQWVATTPRKRKGNT